MAYNLTSELPEDEQHPPDIGFECEVLEATFHPHEQVLAAGLITGRVEIYKYSDEGNLRVAELAHHQKSCRALAFSDDGTLLFTGSSDKSLQAVNVHTGAIVYRERKAHGEAINVLARLNEAVLATGDDDGTIKLWDLRRQGCVRTYDDAHADFVSDMAYAAGDHTLLVTSGDGTLGVYDIRKNEPLAVSEQLEDELLSIALMKNNSKVICGSQEGALNIFSWGEWDDISDRFPGHPSSVDSLVPISDEILLTGSSDGLIRVLTVFPNEFVGVIGEHADFPIERIRLSPSGRYLVSCSHDNTVKFWNVQYLYDEDGDEEEGEEEGMDVDRPGEPDEPEPTSRRGRPKRKEKAEGAAGDFFKDL